MGTHWMSRTTVGRRGVISLLVAGLPLLLPPGATAQLPDPPGMTLTVDDDGMQCITPYTTISAAVLVATPGSIIVVCDGTYQEQVTIDKSLTLQAVADPNQHAIVKAPSVMTDPKAIILVTGALAMNVTIDGFMITGPGGGNCDALRWGIRVDGGATATITHNLIQNIHDSPFGGCQNGIGIDVGRQSDGTTGTATIDGNTIEDYQKGGILVDNMGSSAVITNNVILGVGRTEIIAQNGIQVSRGAMVPPTNLQGNTVMGNFYWNRSAITTPAVATGVLYFQAGETGYEGPINSTNTIRHNQVNVSVTP